jgi:excisionase family DNA binding protein
MLDRPQQLDFGGLLFGSGRTVLCVWEVAERLSVTEQHVTDLIEEGQLQAVNVGGGGRNFWRIPVMAYERFLKERHSLNM